MKQYLKMADVFVHDSVEELEQHVYAGYMSKHCSEYAAHAINSHDELVQMLAVMAELVGKMNCYCHQAGASANKNSGNPVESWMAEADEALDAIRSES